MRERMTIGQAARRLDVTAAALQRAVEAGIIRGTMIDGVWLVTPEAVAEYLSKRTGNAQVQAEEAEDRAVELLRLILDEVQTLRKTLENKA